MRILVIGGTGFIGPFVVRQLQAAGHDLTLFHRGETRADLPPEVAHIHGNRARLADFAGDFRRFAPDVVLDMLPLTANDARAVVETMRGLTRRVVAISSIDVYRAYDRLLRKEPGPPDPTPLTEESPLRGRLFPYRDEQPSAAKMRHSDTLLDDYDKIPVERIIMGDPTLPGTILRLPMVHGPGDYQHRLFPFLRRMDDDRPAILLNEGVAQMRGSRSYVENVATAIGLAVTDERAAGRIYNVAEPGATTEAEWVRLVGRVAGWQGEVVAVRPSRLPEQLRTQMDTAQHWDASSERIRRELGYAEVVPMEEALRRTIAWERAKPPATTDPARFDYDAEDAVIAELAR